MTEDIVHDRINFGALLFHGTYIVLFNVHIHNTYTMYMYLQVPELLLEEYEAVSREGKGVGNTYQAGKLNIVRWALLLFFTSTCMYMYIVPSLVLMHGRLGTLVAIQVLIVVF